MDTAISIAISLAAVSFFVAVWWKGYPTRFTLLEYQLGLLYRRGYPVREIGPGRYWVWVKSEKVLFVDSRPIQAAYENQAAVLRDGIGVGFGILASARAVDVRKAIYASANYNHLPAFIFLCSARAVLNSFELKGLKVLGQEKLAEQIAERARMKLAAAGFEIISFRLTQLSLPLQ